MTHSLLNAQLLLAAKNGALAEVARLIQQGGDLNTRDSGGRTPLMAATIANRPAVVRALLYADADVNIQDSRRDNPFLYASAEGLLDILRLTITARADTRATNRYGGTALIPAAERGHVEVVHELLAHTDVDVNHVNRLGWTALLEAIILGDGRPRHTEVVRLLITHGAEVNLADGKGVTPLTHAKRRGFSDIVALLENAGAR